MMTVNNANKLYPPMYLMPEEVRVEEHLIVHIYVPVGTQVSFSKNPSISKVFREISLADELGSGMRNTYKYTKLY